MKTRTISLSIVTTLFAVLTACEKGPGEGGTSTLKGKIEVFEYCCNQWVLASDTFPGQAEDVYLIYGDDSFYGDKTETHYDGTFEFPFLQKGNYKVYTYSDDTNFVTKMSERMIIMESVEITQNREEVTIPTIKVYKENF